MPPTPPKPKRHRTGAAVPRTASRRPGVGASGGMEPKPKPSKGQAALKGDRAEELRFTVPTAFKQTFKQAAKDLGLKKVALLETLFAEWQARGAPPAETSRSRCRASLARPPPRRVRYVP